MTPEMLQVLVWPFVVLLVGVIFLFLFKKDISNLLSRMRKAKWPGGTETSFNYGDAEIDKSEKKEDKDKVVDSTPLSRYAGMRWSNSGNVFWLGHDLMWTIDVIVRGAPRETIVHGLRQSLHHISSIGFMATPIESRLRSLLENADRTLQTDWTPAERNNYADEVGAIIGYIGKLAESNQSDYQPRPKE